MTRRLAPFLFFVALAAAAFGAIRSYDLFWQLATGRWIVEHRALPLEDPFALASEKREWIDGEWLYEIALYGAHELVGLRGLSLLRGLLAAIIFTIPLFARRDEEPSSALLVSAIGFAGAMAVLDLRPSGMAALMVVLMLASRPLWLRALLTVLWMNVHPSALLAPIAGARRFRDVPLLALALLVNPYGWKAIVAPIELTRMVSAGGFVNAEWLPSSPLRYPILYVAIIAAIALFAFSLSSRADRRPNADEIDNDSTPHPPSAPSPLVEGRMVSTHTSRDSLLPARGEKVPEGRMRGEAIAAQLPPWLRIALLALFAFLAVRHVRNQPLFFAAFAMLAPLPRLRPAIAYAASAFAILAVAITADHRLGVPPERFPIEAVARLRASGLRGNIYNADQFGGYLIWSFYPQRRVLTDGRNELYRTFIPEWQEARVDQRKWNALLRKYRIDLAVEEYRPPLRVTDARTGRVTEMDASLAYWPRDQWVMIAKDEAAMVFARRAAVE